MALGAQTGLGWVGRDPEEHPGQPPAQTGTLPANSVQIWQNEPQVVFGAWDGTAQGLSTSTPSPSGPSCPPELDMQKRALPPAPQIMN